MPNIHNIRTGWQGSVTDAMYDRLIQQSDYEAVPDGFVPWGDRGKEADEVSYTYASGWWTVFVGEEEVGSGRGKDGLEAALAERGSSFEEAEDVTDG